LKPLAISRLRISRAKQDPMDAIAVFGVMVKPGSGGNRYEPSAGGLL
jgi:hypothetical protein